MSTLYHCKKFDYDFVLRVMLLISEQFYQEEGVKEERHMGLQYIQNNGAVRYGYSVEKCRTACKTNQ